MRLAWYTHNANALLTLGVMNDPHFTTNSMMQI